LDIAGGKHRSCEQLLLLPQLSNPLITTDIRILGRN
jgi:hypothetical protein